MWFHIVKHHYDEMKPIKLYCTVQYNVTTTLKSYLNDSVQVKTAYETSLSG